MDEHEKKPEAPKAVWEKRELAINGKMKEVCRLSITAIEAEVKALRRKLEKLQYGGK